MDNTDNEFKHGDYAFQVRTRNRWEVCICNDDMVREYQTLGPEFASLDAVSEDVSPFSFR